MPTVLDVLDETKLANAIRLSRHGKCDGREIANCSFCTKKWAIGCLVLARDIISNLKGDSHVETKSVA